MKGKMELMEILILVVGITISLSLFYFSSQKLIFSRSKVMVETSKYEKLMDASRNFFYARIPLFEKTYAQLLADLISTEGRDVVYYGERYGGLNVTKVIHDYFYSYFEKRWNLRAGDLVFGYEIPKERRTFVMKLPLPSFTGEVIDVVISIW